MEEGTDSFQPIVWLRDSSELASAEITHSTSISGGNLSHASLHSASLQKALAAPSGVLQWSMCARVLALALSRWALYSNQGEVTTRTDEEHCTEGKKTLLELARGCLLDTKLVLGGQDWLVLGTWTEEQMANQINHINTSLARMRNQLNHLRLG